MLTSALGQLLAVAEAYPDLKANQNFLALQNELTADRGPHRRRAPLLQRQRADVNTKVETFPPNIIARMFNFVKQASTSRPSASSARPRGSTSASARPSSRRRAPTRRARPRSPRRR